jgi:hypothetical protein
MDFDLAAPIAEAAAAALAAGDCGYGHSGELGEACPWMLPESGQSRHESP